jgi:hypothetical protein
MMRKLVAFILLMGPFCFASLAQDTLPKFSAVTKGNGKILISWTNQYRSVSQISIQRSPDSTRNFKTILTIPDPSLPQNGFVDAKAITPYQFYRLFIVLDSGKYIFSPSKKAFWDTLHKEVAKEPEVEPNKPENNHKRVTIAANLPPKEAEKVKAKIQEATKETKEPTKPATIPEPEKFFTIKRRDSVVFQVPEKQFKRFRDSLVSKTKDTIAFESVDTIVIKPFIPKEVYKPSKYVYTARDGNVAISLPDVKNKHYALKFFDEDNSPLFEIKQVKEQAVLLDKVNFLHAGWFRFELYEDGKLKEKHKFFIPKDF